MVYFRNLKLSAAVVTERASAVVNGRKFKHFLPCFNARCPRQMIMGTFMCVVGLFLPLFFYYVQEPFGFRYIIYADFSVIKSLLVLKRDEILLISVACLSMPGDSDRKYAL